MTTATQPARYPAWGTYFAGLIQDLPAQEVLDKLQTTQTMVSRWARGSARPTDIGRAKEVAKLFGGSPEEAERAIRADSIAVAQHGSVPAKRAAAKKTAKKAAKKAAKRSTGTRGRATPKSPTGTANTVPAGVLERIRRSRAAIASAERDLDAAVNAARSAGVAWKDIALELK